MNAPNETNDSKLTAKEKLLGLVGTFSEREAANAIELLRSRFALLIFHKGQWQNKCSYDLGKLDDGLAIVACLKVPGFIALEPGQAASACS